MKTDDVGDIQMVDRIYLADIRLELLVARISFFHPRVENSGSVMVFIYLSNACFGCQFSLAAPT